MARTPAQKANRLKRARTKQDREEREIALMQAAVAKHNKVKHKDKRRSKRLTVEEVEERIHAFKRFRTRKKWLLRDPKNWKSPAFNPDKQARDFVRHCFYKYPVPSFLTSYFLRSEYIEHHINESHEFWRELAVMIGQGESFKKLMAGVMTKRECHNFLTNSDNNFDAPKNLWLTRLYCRGIPKATASRIIDRLLRNFDPIDMSDKVKSVVDFYANNHKEMDELTFTSLTDYINNQIRQPDWTAKGRTLGSMIKASNEWHILVQKAKLGEYISWAPLPIDDWELPYMEDGLERKWIVRQLTDNKQLAHEGRKQRHCVFGYVRSCAEGRCFIFTFEHFDGFNTEKHITLEVNRDREIVQARGRQNRSMEPNEQAVLRKWAGERGLVFKTRWGW